jgi:hypothetical protein
MEGDIPKIAVSTGGSDALECLLRRIGIADSEFTNESGMGRVHMYVGGEVGTDANGQGADQFNAALGGQTFTHSTTLWNDVTKMQRYDMLMLSCEGSQYAGTKSPYITNMVNYMNLGGRVFVDHLHFYWLNHGPDEIQGTADYLGVAADLPQPSTALIDTSFPKGNALADWMQAVGGSTTRGQFVIYQGQHSVASVVAPTQRWIYVPMNPNEDNKPSIHRSAHQRERARPSRNARRGRLRSEGSLPRRVQEHGHVGASQGACLHVFRSVGLRRARHIDAQATTSAGTERAPASERATAHHASSAAASSAAPQVRSGQAPFLAALVPLAIFGSMHQARKVRVREGEPFVRLASTSAIPFAAVARGR